MYIVITLGYHEEFWLQYNQKEFFLETYFSFSVVKVNKEIPYNKGSNSKFPTTSTISTCEILSWYLIKRMKIKSVLTKHVFA